MNRKLAVAFKMNIVLGAPIVLTTLFRTAVLGSSCAGKSVWRVPPGGRKTGLVGEWKKKGETGERERRSNRGKEKSEKSKQAYS